MVLGLRSKHRKGASVQVNYLVHVQEIKPWPPSQALRSIQSVLLQWENDDQIFGSLTSVVGNEKIEFDESFTLSSTLCREKKTSNKFQKNYLEFQLYEQRKDKAANGQILGTAIINLADYGIIDKILTVSVPLNCKKSSKIVVQPALIVNIQPFNKDSSNSLSKQVSLEKDGQESVSELISEEIDDGSDIASFTDDDVSSPSSQTVASSAFETKGHLPSQNEKGDLESRVVDNREPTLRMGVEPLMSAVDTEIGASSKPNINYGNNFAKFSERSTTSIGKKQVAPFLQSSLSSMDFRDTDEETSTVMRSFEKKNMTQGFHEVIVESNQKVEKIAQQSVKKNVADKVVDDEKRKQQVNGEDEQISEEKRQLSEDNIVGKYLATRKRDKLRSNTLTSDRQVVGIQASTATTSKLKHVKSVQLPKTSGFSANGHENAKRLEKLEDACQNVGKKEAIEIKEQTEWRSRMEMLEEELRETAAIEAGLFSIVAEHGSSMNKIHAPARRLSRFYLHSCKERSEEKRANAARATISGLVLVSKACGNDVPRLTFWLSNSVMLRAIVIQTVGEGKSSSEEEFDDWQDPETFIVTLEKVEDWIFSRIVESLWWQTFTPHMQSTAAKAGGRSVGLSSRKTSGSKYALSNQERGNFSVELWKKAFKDACERLCPIRAGGHECGCLPVLPRLVMEQLVGRLDVAMFNAILRESAEDMPTDPLSDPIADLRVLPVPAGKSSFGAGAQLKNAIGSWSRWLTDLFGIEDNDSPEDNDNLVNDKKMEFDSSFKPFCLLNALSDLMMLPFEMLGDSATRKEVCPTLSAPLIKRVASCFVPDEFCPNPIPDAVLHALDSEDMEDSEESLTSFPCTASPTVYSPPPAASLSRIIGELGSQALRRSASVLKKSYTSDDELDELESPLNSITDNFRASSTSKRPNCMPKGGRTILRYQLLREVWRDSE